MNGIHFAYNQIKPTDKVLDIGGSAQPFRRANVVIDIMPYEKRESHSSFLQGIPEHFSKETWIQQDISDYRKPFPFKDKEFDFVVCGHVLEDVRDPIFVTSEIQRVAKRGYLEVPSRFHEQMRWVEQKKLCGHSHHRWFVELRKNTSTHKNDLVFVFKNHLIQTEKEYQIRKPWFKRGRPHLNPNYEVLGLYFNGPFDVYEDVLEAVGNSHRFMSETARLARTLGADLWNRSEGLPVEISPQNSSATGIFSLHDLKPQVTKRLKLYDLDGSRSNEILSYEKSLSAGLTNHR